MIPIHSDSHPKRLVRHSIQNGYMKRQQSYGHTGYHNRPYQHCAPVAIIPLNCNIDRSIATAAYGSLSWTIMCAGFKTCESEFNFEIDSMHLINFNLHSNKTWNVNANYGVTCNVNSCWCCCCCCSRLLIVLQMVVLWCWWNDHTTGMAAWYINFSWNESWTGAHTR